MSDQRITQLTALPEASLAANDVLPIADITASETKKITAKDLIEGAIALADSGSIDLIKLNQSSTTKLGATALATGAVTAVKLANNSSVSVGTTAPTVDNFDGRGFYNSSTGVLQVYSAGSYANVAATVGSGTVDTAQLVNGAVTTAKINAAGLAAAALASDSVITAKIADGAVTAAKIAADSITASQIATGAVGAAELADDAVDTGAIVNLAVTEAKLGAGSVTEAKLGTSAVTNDKIANATIAYGKLNLADGSVPGAKIAADSITVDQIGALAVGTSELIASGVTTAKIADGAVTAAKIATDTITASQIATGAVGAAELADDAVDTAAIVDLAITEAKIANGAVTTNKLGILSVVNDTIADGTIVYGKLNLADGSVPGAKIATDSITVSQIGPLAIGTSELADSAVTAAKIADSTITSGKLAASSVAEAAIATTAVTGSKIASGAVTYEKIQATTTTNVVLGRSSAGGGTVEEISLTAAGRALLDDADAAAQRTTLGLGNIALGTGSWTNGSSFAGTASGTNTGDQTITLTGDVTGTGTGSFAATIANEAVTSAKIATGAVTTALLAADSVTDIKLANNSSTVVAASVPIGTGVFVGQQWVNTNTGFEYTWTGSEWQRLHGISTIAISESTPLAFAVSYPDNFSANIAVTLDTQAASAVFVGPATGANAAPTFRSLVPGDLPDATGSTKGIIQPGTGLVVAAGVLNHANSTAGATLNGITFDNQGHITAAVALAPGDIPSLNASKITAGTFSTAFIADNAITGAKLSDYATAQFGETLPVAEYIGQFFFNPLDKNIYLWDGNVWQPVGVSIGELVFGGTYNATTNLVVSTTTTGAAAGLTAGQALPAASAAFVSYYVVVSTGGTGTSPAPTVALAPPDIILCDGTAWREIDVSSTYTAQTASNVGFVPAGTIASTNAQSAIEEVATEAANAANLTSGVVAVARGGTALSSYTKGDLIVASGTTALVKLPVGSNGQVLKANSATGTGLEWGTTGAGTVTTVSSSTGALTVADPTTTPALTIRAATTSVDGIVQLSNSTSTTSSVLAATPTAVKAAYDLAAAALPKAGGVITGTLEIGSSGSLVFEGATDDGFETTLAVADATDDRTLTLPNATGTLISTGDTGSVTSTMIANGAITNDDINASAAIVDTKLATIATAGKVSNSATTATSGNTPSAIVARDGSGNFTAGTITANLTGTASNVTTNANLTGDITSVGNATAIASGVIVDADVNASAAIAFSKLANVSTTDRLLGRSTAGAGAIEEIPLTAAGRALIDDADAAAQRTTLGLGTIATLTAPAGTVVGTTDTQTLTNKTLTDPAIVGTIIEDVFTITDGAAFEVDPANGSIQLITLGASRTPKATNFVAGESITLMVNDGTAFTLTWTDTTWGSGGVIWTGGTAPTLATTGFTVLQFWKVSTQVYGAFVGNVA